MATRVKRYEAPATQFDALLARIEAEMGPQARLETREFTRGGLLGIGGTAMVEVIATLSVDPFSTSLNKNAAGPAPYDPAARARGQHSRDDWGRPGISLSADDSASPLPIMSTAASDLAKQVEAAKVRIRAAQFSQTENETAVEDLKGSLGQFSNALGEYSQPKSIAAAQVESAAAQIAQQIEAEASQPDLPVVLQRPLVVNGSPSMGKVVSQTGKLTDFDKPDKRNSPGSEGPQMPSSIESQRENDHLWTLIEPARPLRQDREPLLQPAPFHYPDLPSLTQPQDAGQSRAQLVELKNRCYQRLLEGNVDSAGAWELVELAAETLSRHVTVGEADDNLLEEALITEVQSELCRSLLLGGGIELGSSLPGRVVALVGPTGVGKTTTLAKLAAMFAFQRGRNVGLVSLDTHRVAAVAQLRAYAEIMGLPLEVAYSPEEYEDAIQRFRVRYDLTLVDTPGFSPQSSDQIRSLRQYFELCNPDEVHLVTSVTYNASSLRKILDSFSVLGYGRVILTKLDEASGPGTLYNVNRFSSAPISYFAVGQSVPEDLRVAGLDFVQHWTTSGSLK